MTTTPRPDATPGHARPADGGLAKAGYFACLPMYISRKSDWAAEKIWAAMASRLVATGALASAPPLLRLTIHEAWDSPNLVFGQTCGYPLTHGYRGRLTVLGVPIYDAPGCTGFNHRSAIIVGRNSAAQTLADLEGCRFGFNSDDSNSGMNLPRHALAPIAGPLMEKLGGRFFGALVETGGHVHSLAQVAAGQIDAAGIDCVTYALMARQEPEQVAATRVLAWTAPSPNLPFVCAATIDPALRQAVETALAAAFADPALAEARAALLLKGLVAPADVDYQVVLDYEEEARRLSYPHLG